MELILLSSIIYAIVSCVICVKLANQKNKDSVVAGIVGFIFGVFAILYYGFTAKEAEKPKTNNELVNNEKQKLSEESNGLEKDEKLKMGYFQILWNGILKENPTFVLLLGMCPTLGTTSSAINGMSMGLATMAVLIFSNLIISCIKNLIPDQVRIPSYIVVIASLVTALQMVMQAYTPEVYKTLGLFIPLIVVNCIILGRAEAFAAKNGPIESLFDGIGIGLGFTIALTLLGGIRELLGTGKIFDVTIYSENYGMLLFVLAPGAFIALGYLIAIVKKTAKI